MKVKISYSIPVEKEIEISPKEYCLLRANFNSRPDLFPAESFWRDLTDYDVLDKESRNELNNFFDERG